MKKRIGPKMLAVEVFVSQNPGCTKMAAAHHVGPHGSLQFGYASVNRAIKAKLIVARHGSWKRTYALFASEVK